MTNPLHVDYYVIYQHNSAPPIFIYSLQEFAFFIFGVALLLAVAAWDQSAIAALLWVCAVVGSAALLGLARHLWPAPVSSGEKTNARTAAACGPSRDAPLDARAALARCASTPLRFVLEPQDRSADGESALTAPEQIVTKAVTAASPLPSGLSMWQRQDELLHSAASRVIASGQAASHRRRRIAATLSLLNAGTERAKRLATAWVRAPEPACPSGSRASSAPSSPVLTPLSGPSCCCCTGSARSSMTLEASRSSSDLESRSSASFEFAASLIMGSGHCVAAAAPTSAGAYGTPVLSGGLWPEDHVHAHG